DNLTYLYSICLLPLFCAGLEKVLVGTRPWAVAPAVVWATLFLNGDVQTGYYYGFIALLWAWARAPGAYREAGLRLALITGLALLGAWRRRDLNVFVVLGGVALLLSLGQFGGLYAVLYKVVPLWSAFRYPEKFIGVVTFAAAMLAGAGLDVLRTDQGRPAPWFVATALCTAAWLGLRTEAASMWTTAYFGATEGLAREVTQT